MGQGASTSELLLQYWLVPVRPSCWTLAWEISKDWKCTVRKLHVTVQFIVHKNVTRCSSMPSTLYMYWCHSLHKWNNTCFHLKLTRYLSCCWHSVQWLGYGVSCAEHCSHLQAPNPRTQMWTVHITLSYTGPVSQLTPAQLCP